MRIIIAHLDNCGIYQGPSEVVANLDKELKKLGQETRLVYETSFPELKAKVKEYSLFADALVVIGYLGSVATGAFPESKPVIWSWDEVPENHWNLEDVPLYSTLHFFSRKKNVFIVTGTQDDANVIEKIYKRIDYVVPYGIDWDLHSNGSRPVRSLPFKVLQVGWLGRGKNQMDTLQAFKAFLDTRPDSTLTLVGGKINLGSGPAYWDRCVDYIKENHLPVVMMGSLPKEQVKAFYYWADVSINPLNNTGGQLTVMEGICAGLPTIVSSKFVLKDTMRPFGLVTDDYLRALLEVRDSWHAYHQMALKGRAWIQDNFTWPKWAKAMLSIIEEKV